MPYRLLILVALILATASPAAGQAAVVAAAEAVLAERFPDDVHRVEVRVVRTGGRFDAEAALRIRLATDRGMPSGHTQAKVLTGSDAEGWREQGWALLYVAHYDSVAVARADVRDGDPVDAEDLSFAWLETTRFAGTPYAPEAWRALSASGAVFANKPLHEGRPLRAGDLRPAYAADTGEAVTVRYQRGRVTLRLPCKAREPGAVGDVIRVYATDAAASYRVRLTGPGTAEWVETL